MILKSFINRFLFGSHNYTFEEKLFLFITFNTALFTLLFIIPANMFQHYPLYHTLLTALFALLCLFYCFMARFKNQYYISSFLLTIHLTLGLLYIFNAGIEGTIPYFLCLIFLFTIILLRGIKRHIMIYFQSFLTIILFSIDKLFPDVIYKYKNSNESYFDHAVSIFLVYLISIALLKYLISVYDMERCSITEQLKVVSKKAQTDELTGLFNRRYLEDYIKLLQSRLDYNMFSYSIIMADIDFFKNINDKYGHSTGDAVLKTVSSILSYQLRSSDLVARYGGEEFIFILPETKPENAFVLAEKTRKAIATYNWKLIVDDLAITMSFGVAGYSHKNPEIIKTVYKPRDIIEYADSSLYKAKERGRNMTVNQDIFSK